MFQTILVPLDGSPLAERALPFAARLCRASGGRLVLVRATLDLRAPLLAPSAAEPIIKQQLSAAEQATAALNAVAERLRAEGLTVQTHVAADVPEELIAKAADSSHADLIVLSTHGRSGLGRWVYGSVADHVVRTAQVPVLVVPPSSIPEWPTNRKLRCLVPLDGSDRSAAVLGPAKALAATLDAELLLLQVVEPPSAAFVTAYPTIPLDTEAELARATQYLQDVAAELRAQGRTVTVQAVLGNPSVLIAQTAREQGADALLMATHGRSGLARFALGSVATGTLQRATVPVLLVRPDQVRRAAARERAEAASEGEPVAPPKGPTVAVQLSRPDLDLLQRGLAELLYTPDRDWRLARSVRDLLARLQQAAAALQTGGEGKPAQSETRATPSH